VPSGAFLNRWQVSTEELNEILTENPSARGLVLGYVAEYKLRKMFRADLRLTVMDKPSDHDRKHKGDIPVTYNGEQVTFEVKSLQTHTVSRISTGYIGKFQCDASDRRTVTLPNGETIETTCLLVGEFDILAVNLFEFGGEWKFAFASNADLPRSTYKGYTTYQKKHLLSTMMPITWPLRAPYHEEPWDLLDDVVRRRVH
jgi:hypothetical protein